MSTDVPLLITGRIPKYWGDTCRHRAWEHRRDLALDRAPVEVVVQRIQVEKVRGKELAVRRNGPGWSDALTQLAHDIDPGRVYGRHLRALGEPLQHVLRSLERRRASCVSSFPVAGQHTCPSRCGHGLRLNDG